MNRFIKLLLSPETDFLQENYPNAFLLLIQIAKTARRTSGGLDGLEIGDSIVGEIETSKKAGLSSKEYRNALMKLEEFKYIEVVYNPVSSEPQKRAIKRATKSKVVNLLKLDICDINPDNKGEQRGDLGATLGRPKGDKQERIRKNKKEKEEHTHGLRAVGCDVVFPFEKSFEDKQPARVVVTRNNGDHVDGVLPSKSKESESKPDSKKSFGKEKTVKLTQMQYEELLNSMTDQEREYWINELTLVIGRDGGEENFNKKNGPSHYHTILYWKKYREEKSKITPLLIKPTPGDNQKIAQEFKDQYESKYYKIEILSNGVEFVPMSGQCIPQFVAYDSHGFKSQIENLIIKKGFKLLRYK